jgi:Spy/CpxP family protein refolding chaperone
MRNFSRLLLAAALLLPFAAHPALAQSTGTPPAGSPEPKEHGGGGGGQRRLAELLHGITLTAGQQKQIDEITAANRAKMPAYTPGTQPDSATRHEMRTLMQQTNGEIRAVLTDDQRKIWDQNLATMRANRQHEGGTN